MRYLIASPSGDFWLAYDGYAHCFDISRLTELADTLIQIKSGLDVSDLDQHDDDILDDVKSILEDRENGQFYEGNIYNLEGSINALCAKLQFGKGLGGAEQLLLKILMLKLN